MADFKSLSALKRSVQQEKIKIKIAEEYMKTPIGKEPNRKKLSKLLGVSENTISMAFEDTAKPKEDDMRGIITKALGIATPLVLLEEENMDRVTKFLGENGEVAGVMAGAYLVWNQFVKPRIDDPKNDLSELEVVIELAKSRLGQGLVAGIFSLLGAKFLAPLLTDALGNFGDTIRDGFINFQSSAKEVIDDAKEIIEDAKENIEDAVIQGYEFVRDLFKLQKIVSIRTFPYPTFPSYEDWILEQPKILQVTYKFGQGILLGIANYRKDKKEFINKEGQNNVFDFKDLDQAVLERERELGTQIQGVSGEPVGGSDKTVDEILAEQEKASEERVEEAKEVLDKGVGGEQGGSEDDSTEVKKGSPIRLKG